MPVPVTTIFPRPPVTTVPPMTMFFRSAKGVSGGRPLPSRLATAPDSPVIADGGDVVSRFQPDDVAGDEIRAVQLGLPAVPQDLGLGGRELA